MKIVLIGASGYVGAPLLKEALDRGHAVTAIVRHPEKLPTHRSLTPLSVDVYDAAAIAAAVAGHDAVVSAFSPGAADPDLYEHHLQGVRAILEGVKRAGVTRLLMVGGAGSLEVAPGVQVVDMPQFPAEWKPTALATREALKLLSEEPTLQWVFLSPAAELVPGERTGRYRVGNDQLLTDTDGHSRISLQDYAVAMIDELERAAHTRQRFTVAY